MTRKDIVYKLESRTGLNTHLCERAVREIINIIADAILRQEPIYIRGLATIKPVTRKATTRRDIKRGKPVQVPQKKQVKFITSPAILTRLNLPNEEYI